jgi:hypothetical protein
LQAAIRQRADADAAEIRRQAAEKKGRRRVFQFLAIPWRRLKELVAKFFDFSQCDPSTAGGKKVMEYRKMFAFRGRF